MRTRCRFHKKTTSTITWPNAQAQSDTHYRTLEMLHIDTVPQRHKGMERCIESWLPGSNAGNLPNPVHHDRSQPTFRSPSGTAGVDHEAGVRLCVCRAALGVTSLQARQHCSVRNVRFSICDSSIQEYSGHPTVFQRVAMLASSVHGRGQLCISFDVLYFAAPHHIPCQPASFAADPAPGRLSTTEDMEPKARRNWLLDSFSLDKRSGSKNPTLECLIAL